MQRARILLIDDDEEFAATMARLIQSEGYDVETALTGDAGLERALAGEFDVVVTDIHFQTPGLDGLEVVRKLHAGKRHLPIMVITAYPSTDRAIKATNLGARDYLIKDSDLPSKLLALLAKAVDKPPPVVWTAEPGQVFSRNTIIGASRQMREVSKQIGRLADKPFPILILGAPGTGKKLVARYLHEYSDRAKHPYKQVGCFGAPKDQLESELWGHEPDAVAGAAAPQVGRFEQADHGTIFLNEVAALTLDMQAKVLRALEEKTIQRPGCKESIRVDVRLIADTHQDLERAVREGRFLQGLYDRLCVAVIRIPSLRERRDDVPELVKYFMQTLGADFGYPNPSITAEAIKFLQEQHWPGNVPELESLVGRALLKTQGLTIGLDDVRAALGRASGSAQTEREGAAPAGPTPTQRVNIPEYELLQYIDRGSYGEVWLAKSVTGRYRAVKVVYRKSFEHDRPYEREFEGIQKFEKISGHAGLVNVLHVGRDYKAGYFYYVMELGDDQTTAQEINPHTYRAKTLGSEISRQRKLSVDKCVTLGLSLTAALAHLHGHDLIHRDIKPSNVIFVDGTPKLADIGLVAGADETCSFVGTEGFIPPQGPGTRQSDLYSLGKLLYVTMTGLDAVDDFPALPADVSEDMTKLNKIILKACETDVRKRYRAAEELHAALARLQQSPPPPSVFARIRRKFGLDRKS